MRVLVCDDKKNDSALVLEIGEIGFDADIFDSADKGLSNEKAVSGLFMYLCPDWKYLYIPGVPASTCLEVCREILRTGFYDLYSLGEIMEL